MWNEAVQTMDRKALRSTQEEHLKSLVCKLYERVPFYKERMDREGVRPEDIRTLADIAKLPFTSKEDMREVFPFGLLAADKADIVEIHMSSGTTGKAVVGAYTQKDIDIWSDTMARTLNMGNTGPEDVVQNSFGYGLFTGGFGVHYGARALGAMVLPISSGNTLRQVRTMQDFGTTVITCTPSYSLYMAEWAKDHGVDIAALSLKAGFFGAEPWSDSMRRDIEIKLGIKAFDIYGLTEIIGPGVAAECACQDGLHVFEDHFYPEIIDPQTGQVLPPGEKGELVLTTLTRQGTPVIRYRTRDITYLMEEPCSCGRTARRIHRLMGRNDDMLIIRGVNVFPAQVEEVLLRIQGVEPHYRLIVDRQGTMDSLDVEVEMSESLFSDEVKTVMALERQIERELKAALNIQTKVTLVNPKSIARSEGKARRIVDKREIKNRA
jgi:phenylacetate-CoA ligase